MKITTLDYAILGLLKQEAMTGYAIRMAFETTALGTFSGSPGAIYPALHRLSKQQLVEQGSLTDENHLVYFISDTGIDALYQWCILPIQQVEIEKQREMLILKFAFMEQLVPNKQCIQYLIQLRKAFITYRESLLTYYSTDAQLLPIHGRLAFEHGLTSIDASIKWCSSSLKQLRK